MPPVNYKITRYPAEIPLKRILVVEPSRINWIGLHRLLVQVGTAGFSFCRVSEIAEAKKKMYEFKPDVVLFTSLSPGTDYVLLLSFLSDVCNHYPQTRLVIRLQHDMAWMMAIFHVFGVGVILIDPVSTYEMGQCLGREPVVQRCLLGKRERSTALALLRGDSPTMIAIVSGKNIRTISAQKKSIIRKLNMKTHEELYLLAGRLAYVSKMNRGGR